MNQAPMNHGHNGSTSLRVRLSDPARLHELLDFFEVTVYAPRKIDDDTLEVTAPPALEPGIAYAELGIYLRLWERLHPQVTAQIVT